MGLFLIIFKNCRTYWVYFRTGPKPKMPGKSLNKALSAEENSLLAKLSKDNNIILPNGLKHKYTVGRMIGDGIFYIDFYVVFVLL